VSTTTAERFPFSVSPALLASVALIELVLLRIGTRTLIHIPGLGRFEAPIRVVAEVGRFAYYLSVVLLIYTLVRLASRDRHGPVRLLVRAGVTVVFLGVAGAGRLGLVTVPVVGWISAAVLIVVTVASWQGIRMLPVAWFVLGWLAAAGSVLGQGIGGNLTVGQVNSLMLVAEFCLIGAAATLPLLQKVRPSSLAVFAGLGTALVAAGGFRAGSSTLSILVLWNLGVPGWLPGIAYAGALGFLVTTVWSAVASGQQGVAAGLVVLLAGGLGTISTYQTGLVLVGVLLLGEAVSGRENPAERARSGDRVFLDPEADALEPAVL